MGVKIMPVKKTKILKWNKDLVIHDLFGVAGSKVILGCTDYKFGKRYIDNYSYFTIELKNDLIDFYRCVRFHKNGYAHYNKIEGKRRALEIINANKTFYLDCMKSQSQEELDLIIEQTKLYWRLEKNYKEMDILQKKKAEYEEDYRKQKEKYEYDLANINLPLKWIDKIVGQRVVGSERRLVSKCIGRSEPTYRRLPDREPRSSFESPDYEIISGGGPIYADSYEYFNVYENITEKQPILREPKEPKMGYGFKDLIDKIVKLQIDINIGEGRKKFILENPERYI